MNLDLLKSIAAWLGLPVVLILAGAILVTVYPQAKILIGDLLSLAGWTAKWIRRASLQNEIEGSLSLFARNYNGDLATPLLPQVEVKWVTEKSIQTVWEPGKLIVKVSLGKDHDRNLYAATTAFVNAGLLPRAKVFLAKTTSEAIDLLLIRTILRDARRSALAIFNDGFREIKDDCRDTYFKLEEIENRRLFQRILLQEYFFLGEELGDSVPRPEYAAEADDFLSWLYDLATREQDELSILHFPGKHIRVGAILVARQETYEQHGVDPYLRRANLYAADGYGTVYLLSRGRRRSTTTKRIASELTADGHFRRLTDRPDLKVKSAGEIDIVTIIPLRVDIVGIINSAWEKLEQASTDGTSVTVTVESVDDTSVTVYAFGLRVNMSSTDLSDLEIRDARQYFHKLQELIVRVIEVDQEEQHVRLSNRLGKTDPKTLVDALKTEIEEGTEARVESFRNVDGFDVGLIVALKGGQATGFVPRSKATAGRFVPLSEKYSIGDNIQVKGLRFEPRFNNFVCEVTGVHDPWSEIDKYIIGRSYPAILREISEHRMLYEVEEGVEGVVFVEEVAWASTEENRRTIRSRSVGERDQVKILSINPKYRELRLSLKRVRPSRTQDYFTTHDGQTLEAAVEELNAFGARVQICDTQIKGFIGLSELSWLYCGDPSHFLSVGQALQVVIIGYDDRHDQLRLSSKRVLPNDFEELKARLSVGSEVTGKILHQVGASVQVRLTVDDIDAVGYVHKGEASNLMFVRDADLSSLFAPGESLSFLVKRFDEKNRVVELNRKGLFVKAFSELQYGESYKVRVVKQDRLRAVAGGQRVEGCIVGAERQLRVGEELTVNLARLGTAVRDVEFTPDN